MTVQYTAPFESNRPTLMFQSAIDESRDDVRARNGEVQEVHTPTCNEVWIRRAKGRISSTTKKFVYSCILRGGTASSHSTVSYLSKKSTTPRKHDYMKVPDLTQFVKKDQNIQKDPNRFDFTTAEPENDGERDELPTDASESSTNNQQNVKVPFPRSNSAEEIRWIGVDQSANCISSWPVTALPIDQSEPSACATSDQSEAVKAQPICYKSSGRNQPVSCVLPSKENSTIDATYSVSRNILSNSIDFIENRTRPYSSSFIRSILANLICLVRSSRRILRRKTKQHKCRRWRYRLIRALCVVIGLCSSPTIATICWCITESLGMVFLRFIRTLMLGMANTSEERNIEPDSDD